MALTNKQLEDASMPLARAIRSPEAIRRERRVDRAVDLKGNVIIQPPDFTRQRSPDGSIWRIKVSNTGAITAVKE